MKASSALLFAFRATDESWALFFTCRKCVTFSFPFPKQKIPVKFQWKIPLPEVQNPCFSLFLPILSVMADGNRIRGYVTTKAFQVLPVSA